jgi:hypothetical protein
MNFQSYDEQTPADVKSATVSHTLLRQLLYRAVD